MLLPPLLSHWPDRGSIPISRMLGATRSGTNVAWVRLINPGVDFFTEKRRLFVRARPWWKISVTKMGKQLAIVTELFEPSLGGQEYRYSQIASAMVQIGYSPTIYTIDHTGGQLPPRETRQGITIERYASIKNYLRPGMRGAGELLRYVHLTRDVVKSILKESDQPILVNQMPVVHLLALPRNPRIVVDWCEYPTRRGLNHLVRTSSRFHHRGTSVGNHVGQPLRLLSSKSDMTVVRTPIDLVAYSPTRKDTELILTASRLVPHKNVATLCRAVVLLSEKYGIKKRLVVLGDGPLRRALETEFSRYQFIEFRGRVETATKIQLFREAWLFALLSMREGLPNSVAEAVAAGVPIVTSSFPENGTRTFVEGEGVGMVVNAQRAEYVAAALAKLDDGQWTLYHKRAMTLRKEFSPEVSSTRLADFLQAT